MHIVINKFFLSFGCFQIYNQFTGSGYYHANFSCIDYYFDDDIKKETIIVWHRLLYVLPLLTILFGTSIVYVIFLIMSLFSSIVL